MGNLRERPLCSHALVVALGKGKNRWCPALATSLRASLVSEKMDLTRSTCLWLIFLVLQPLLTHGYRQRMNNVGSGNRQLQQRPTRPPLPNPHPGIVGFMGGGDPNEARKMMYYTYRRFLAIRLFKQGIFEMKECMIGSLERKRAWRISSITHVIWQVFHPFLLFVSQIINTLCFDEFFHRFCITDISKKKPCCVFAYFSFLTASVNYGPILHILHMFSSSSPSSRTFGHKLTL